MSHPPSEEARRIAQAIVTLQRYLGRLHPAADAELRRMTERVSDLFDLGEV